MNGEFDLIARFFQRTSRRRSDVTLGIGDDCALVSVPQDQELALGMDTMVEGVHFLADTRAANLGHKALAVNLSDLAAMGACPAWATLAVTMPAYDEQWLGDFSSGFLELAERFDVQLIGGDTTRGPLCITVQAHGLVPTGLAIRRSGAAVGDAILITGTIGGAAVALRAMRGQLAMATGLRDLLQARLERPQPRVAAGMMLRGLASAAIDVSDGLAQDLGHILLASEVGATLWVDQLPHHEIMAAGLSRDDAVTTALSGGDDYELCFTSPAHRIPVIQAKLEGLGVAVTEIGRVEEAPGLRLRGDDGLPFRGRSTAGYDHFS